MTIKNSSRTLRIIIFRLQHPHNSTPRRKQLFGRSIINKPITTIKRRRILSHNLQFSIIIRVRDRNSKQPSPPIFTTLRNNQTLSQSLKINNNNSIQPKPINRSSKSVHLKKHRRFKGSTINLINSPRESNSGKQITIRIERDIIHKFQLVGLGKGSKVNFSSKFSLLSPIKPNFHFIRGQKIKLCQRHRNFIIIKTQPNRSKSRIRSSKLSQSTIIIHITQGPLVRTNHTRSQKFFGNIVINNSLWATINILDVGDSVGVSKPLVLGGGERKEEEEREEEKGLHGVGVVVEFEKMSDVATGTNSGLKAMGTNEVVTRHHSETSTFFGFIFRSSWGFFDMGQSCF